MGNNKNAAEAERGGAAYAAKLECEGLTSGRMSFASATSRLLQLNHVFVSMASADETAFDQAFAQAEILASAFATRPAENLEDIAFKVDAWFLMVPEDAMNPEIATCDERLAFSIMNDIRRLAGRE